MGIQPRPKGITETAFLMSLTNAMGWLTVDWSRPHAVFIFSLNTVFIIAGYVVLWFYWKGLNWARIMVLLGSLLSLYNLWHILHFRIITQVMVVAEAALGLFLLFWLNSQPVKSFFRNSQITANQPPQP